MTTSDVEANSFAKAELYDIYTYPVDVYFKYPEGNDLYLQAQENIKDIPGMTGLDVSELHATYPTFLAAKILKDYGLATGKIGVDLENLEVLLDSFFAIRKPLDEILHRPILLGEQVHFRFAVIRFDQPVHFLFEHVVGRIFLSDEISKLRTCEQSGLIRAQD